jgi:hypothetical protein
MKTPSRRSLLVELFWTRTGLLVLLMLITSGVLLTLSGRATSNALRDLITAVGTGALVSALVTTGQTLLTATASRQVLVDSLVDESRQAMRDLTTEYRSMNNEFFPTHVFESTPEPDPAFNRLMMADLHSTRHYLFRGFSARHAAARTLLAHSLERELRVVIADPRDRNSINSRARYLLRQSDVSGSYTEISAQLYEEICTGLVGLYVARGRCTRIDITVSSNPPADRFELFDDSIWVALFSDVSGTCARYPRTLRFQRTSFIFNMQHSEFVRICNSRTAMHESIYPDTDREEFIAMYEKVTGRRLSVKRLETLEESFHAFRREFATQAQLGG